MSSEPSSSRRESVPPDSHAGISDAGISGAEISGADSLASSARPESTLHLPGQPSKLDRELDQQQETVEPQAAVFAEAKTVIRKPSSGDAEPGNHANGNAGGVAAGASLDRRATPAAVAQVLVGQRLNHFRIDALIGGGGMGAVFRSHDEQLDRVVAVKVIPFVADDPDLQRRFRNESQSAAKLDHPQIARIFDAGRHDEWHYIVFEYVQGTNIRDWVQQRGVLQIDDAVFFTSQIADALQHAADRGIVHRDVKPSNVLISGESGIKLVDMGLARSAHLELADDLTASGVTLGTFDYISPEQAQDPRDADLRSDIYSLGCTLYFMLTGQPPYPGGTMLQKLLKHENSPPPDPREVRSDISTDLSAVMAKMLAKSPQHRYQNAHDLMADLHEIATRENLHRAGSLGPTTIPKPSPLRLVMERHFPWIGSFAVILLVAGWLGWQSSGAEDGNLTPPVTSDLIRQSPRDRVVDSNRDATHFPPSIESSLADGRDLAANDNSGASLRIADSSQTGLDSGPSTSFPLPDQLAGDLAGAASERLGPVPLATEFSASESVSRGEDGENAAFESPVQMGVRLIHDGERLIERLLDGVGREFAPRSIEVVSGNDSGMLQGLSDGCLVTDSLPRALKLAKDFGIEQITLASEQIISPPIRIDLPQLRIRSKLVGGSVVEFVSPEVIDLSRPVMCDLGTGKVSFEELHFVWRVPQEVDGGVLFRMSPQSQTRLASASITIHNRFLRDGVVGFEVAASRDEVVPDTIGINPPTTNQNPSSVDLDFTNVVIRGEMTLLSMQQATKLWMTWDNGLLAISEWMIDTPGGTEQASRTQANPTSGLLRLSLSRVTARSAQGLCRTRLGTNNRFPISISRFARNCVFVVDTDRVGFEVVNYPADHLILQPGVSSDRSLEFAGGVTAPLRIEGSSNAYVVESTLRDSLLRLVLDDGQVQTAAMAELSNPLVPWIDENHPRWSVLWETGVLPGGAMSDHLPEDYRQKGELNPGFDEKMLPVIPSRAN